MKFIKKNLYKILIALFLCFTITFSIFGITKSYADDTQNDSNIGYEIDTPEFAYGYANLNTLGGMSYKAINLFDKNSVTLDYILNATTGTISYDVNYFISDYIEVLEGSIYNYNLGVQFGTAFYDINKSYISGGAYTTTFTIPSGVKYIRMSAYKTRLDTLMICKGSTFPSSYVSYVGNFEGIRDIAITSISSIIEYDIPSNIQGIYGYGWGINDSCFNYIDFVNNKFIQNVDRVDLGTITPIYDSTFKKFNYTIPSIKLPSANVDVGNLLMANYDTMSAQNLLTSLTTDMCIAISVSNVLSVRNLSYTDSQDFKNAMSGVYLYFELATPIETDISSYLSTNQIPIKNDVDLVLNNQYDLSVPYDIDFDMGNDNLLCPYNLIDINNEPYYISYNKFNENDLIRGKYDITGTFIEDSNYYVTNYNTGILDGNLCISNNVNNINFEFVLFDYQYVGGSAVYTYLDTLIPNQYGILYFDVNDYTHHNLVFKVQFYYVGDYNDRIMINAGFFPRYYMEYGTFRSPVVYAELQNQYNQLQANYNQLLRDYDDLQSSYDSLNDNYNDLLDLYNNTSGNALANILNGTTISAFNVNGGQYATDSINNVESNYYSFSVNNSSLYNQVVNHSTNTMLYFNTYIAVPFNFINNNSYQIFVQLWNTTLIDTIYVDSNSSVLIEPRSDITQMRVGIFGNGTADFAFTTQGYGDAYNNGFQNGYASNKRIVDDLTSRVDTLTNSINVLSSSYNDLQSSYENLLSGNNFSNLFFTIAQTPFESFKQIWNVDFLGVNLSGFVTGILFIGLIIWLIKKVF